MKNIKFLIYSPQKGNGLSKDAIEENGTNKCVLYGELYTTYSEIIDKVQSKTNSKSSSLSKKGDILIPASTTTRGIDLVTASVILEDNVYLGGDITILRNKDESIVNNSYFAYYFSNGLIKEVSRLTQGSTIIHLYWKDFKKVNVKLPPLKEQEKITNLFENLDKKLNNIDNIIDSTQKFKKGLLQQMFGSVKNLCVLKNFRKIFFFYLSVYYLIEIENLIILKKLMYFYA